MPGHKDLLDATFGTGEPDTNANCAVLAPTNTFVNYINEEMLKRMTRADTVTYYSTDTVEAHDS